MGGFEPASYKTPEEAFGDVMDFVDDPIVSADSFIDDAGGFIGGLFGRRRLHASLDKLPSILYNELSWNGTSDCDIYVHAYQQYNMTELRPIERLQLIRCVDQRSMAIKLAQTSGIPIPQDIIYNWKRKYII